MNELYAMVIVGLALIFGGIYLFAIHLRRRSLALRLAVIIAMFLPAADVLTTSVSLLAICQTSGFALLQEGRLRIRIEDLPPIRRIYIGDGTEWCDAFCISYLTDYGLDEVELLITDLDVIEGDGIVTQSYITEPGIYAFHLAPLGDDSCKQFDDWMTRNRGLKGKSIVFGASELLTTEKKKCLAISKRNSPLSSMELVEIQSSRQSSIGNFIFADNFIRPIYRPNFGPPTKYVKWWHMRALASERIVQLNPALPISLRMSLPTGMLSCPYRSLVDLLGRMQKRND